MRHGATRTLHPCVDSATGIGAFYGVVVAKVQDHMLSVHSAKARFSVKVSQREFLCFLPEHCTTCLHVQRLWPAGKQMNVRNQVESVLLRTVDGAHRRPCPLWQLKSDLARGARDSGLLVENQPACFEVDGTSDPHRSATRRRCSCPNGLHLNIDLTLRGHISALRVVLEIIAGY